MDTASLPSLDRPSPSPSLLTPPYHSASKLTASPVRYTHSNTKRSLMCSSSTPSLLLLPPPPPHPPLCRFSSPTAESFHLKQRLADSRHTCVQLEVQQASLKTEVAKLQGSLQVGEWREELSILMFSKLFDFRRAPFPEEMCYISEV